MTNYYEILGVADNATAEEIRLSFKRQAVKYHPDKNPDDPQTEERFKEINEAYQILSNPYSKARYDLMRQYGMPEEISYTYQPRDTSPPPYARSRQTAPRVDYEENWKATLYAFGFTLVVAVIVMAAIGLKQWYDRMREEDRLATRRSTFENAQTLYAAGNLDSTFVLINTLRGFDQEKELDMALFQEGLIAEVKYLGESNYISGNYQDAILYLELLDKHTEVRELSLKEALAIAYKETSRPDKSIEIYNQLMIIGYRNIYTYVQMAEIYRDDYHDYEQALTYFELANKAARKHYESTYGKAYVVILSGAYLPDLHYRLYTGLAEIYLRLDQPAKAIDVTRWNKQVWPHRKENYQVAAEGYRRLGKTQEANEELLRMSIKADVD